MKVPASELVLLLNERDQNTREDTTTILEWLKPVTLDAIYDFMEELERDRIVWVEARVLNMSLILIGVLMDEPQLNSIDTSLAYMLGTEPEKAVRVGVPLAMAAVGIKEDVYNYLVDIQAEQYLGEGEEDVLLSDEEMAELNEEIDEITKTVKEVMKGKHEFDIGSLTEDQINDMIYHEQTSKGKVH